MNTFGVERRWVRAGWLGTRVGVRGPLIALAAAAVFGCSFALSHLTRSSSAAHSEVPPGLSVASVSATIPARLSGVQPLESVLEPPPPPAPRRSSATATSQAQAPAVTAPAEALATPAPRPEGSGSSAAAPAAPVESAPPRSSSPSGGGHRSSSSSGSFESSG